MAFFADLAGAVHAHDRRDRNHRALFHVVCLRIHEVSRSAKHEIGAAAERDFWLLVGGCVGRQRGRQSRVEQLV